MHCEQSGCYLAAVYKVLFPIDKTIDGGMLCTTMCYCGVCVQQYCEHQHLKVKPINRHYRKRQFR